MTFFSPAFLAATKRAFIVALVVGPILTLINQWGVMTGPAHLDWIKAGLSCLVPFCVSFFSSRMAQRAFKGHMDQAKSDVEDAEARIAVLEKALREADVKRS
ncbi:hypothetical protein N9L47_11315 [Rhodobacteraceae bacterium]|nr:hypothetical protein [Paracoccaceae bacterium]